MRRLNQLQCLSQPNSLASLNPNMYIYMSLQIYFFLWYPFSDCGERNFVECCSSLGWSAYFLPPSPWYSVNPRRIGTTLSFVSASWLSSPVFISPFMRAIFIQLLLWYYFKRLFSYRYSLVWILARMIREAFVSCRSPSNNVVGANQCRGA